MAQSRKRIRAAGSVQAGSYLKLTHSVDIDVDSGNGRTGDCRAGAPIRRPTSAIRCRRTGGQTVLRCPPQGASVYLHLHWLWSSQVTVVIHQM